MHRHWTEELCQFDLLKKGTEWVYWAESHSLQSKLDLLHFLAISRRFHLLLKRGLLRWPQKLDEVLQCPAISTLQILSAAHDKHTYIERVHYKIRFFLRNSSSFCKVATFRRSSRRWCCPPWITWLWGSHAPVLTQHQHVVSFLRHDVHLHKLHTSYLSFFYTCKIFGQ